jgi:Hemerythrin HHE cation binding domain
MDVTEVILRDHVWFRQQFIALYDQRAATPPDVEAISAIWDPLAARLDVHAVGEEEIFYPQLLARGEEDPEEETLDAIGDHNDIRDGVHAAARHPVASEAWWAAVSAAREANDEHMAEEEREGIADFRLHAAAELRERLGRELEDFLERHPTTAGVDVEDKDPEEYVDEIESDLHPNDDGSTARRTDGSLGIGSLKGHLA